MERKYYELLYVLPGNMKCQLESDNVDVLREKIQSFPSGTSYELNYVTQVIIKKPVDMTLFWESTNETV